MLECDVAWSVLCIGITKSRPACGSGMDSQPRAEARGEECTARHPVGRGRERRVPQPERGDRRQEASPKPRQRTNTCTPHGHASAGGERGVAQRARGRSSLATQMGSGCRRRRNERVRSTCEARVALRGCGSAGEADGAAWDDAASQCTRCGAGVLERPRTHGSSTPR